VTLSKRDRRCRAGDQIHDGHIVDDDLGCISSEYLRANTLLGRRDEGAGAEGVRGNDGTLGPSGGLATSDLTATNGLELRGPNDTLSFAEGEMAKTVIVRSF